MRTFPGWSVMGSSQTSSEVHVRVAVVAAPVSSTNDSGELLLAPFAWFQLLAATTPATSVAPMEVPRPTKSMLMGLGNAAELVIFSVVVPEWVNVPLVPVTVIAGLPIGVLAVVVMVNVEDPEVVMEVGAKVPLAPLGRPPTVRVTEPVKPFRVPTVTVYVAVPPGMMEVMLGEIASEKSEAVTVSVIVTECAAPSGPVPVTVTV
jgi:hypothetical protein